jgi:hypothetical protein
VDRACSTLPCHNRRGGLESREVIEAAARRTFELGLVGGNGLPPQAETCVEVSVLRGELWNRYIFEKNQARLWPSWLGKSSRKSASRRSWISDDSSAKEDTVSPNGLIPSSTGFWTFFAVDRYVSGVDGCFFNLARHPRKKRARTDLADP